MINLDLYWRVRVFDLLTKERGAKDPRKYREAGAIA